MVSAAVGQLHDPSSLIPIIIAAMLWGNKWVGKTVRALCDNMAIVHVLHSRQSKDLEIMHLLRCLSLVECCLPNLCMSSLAFAPPAAGAGWVGLGWGLGGPVGN